MNSKGSILISSSVCYHNTHIITTEGRRCKKSELEAAEKNASYASYATYVLVKTFLSQIKTTNINIME